MLLASSPLATPDNFISIGVFLPSSHLRETDRETETGRKLSNLKPHPQCHISSNKARLPSSFQTVPLARTKHLNLWACWRRGSIMFKPPCCHFLHNDYLFLPFYLNCPKGNIVPLFTCVCANPHLCVSHVPFPFYYITSIPLLLNCVGKHPQTEDRQHLMHILSQL